MLTYSMEDRNGLSMYEYLYHCIKSDVLSCRLLSGEKLPSKRSLAKNLGISVITVENAYAQLIAEGFIYSVEKRGYYVASLGRLSHDNSTKQSTDKDVSVNSSLSIDSDKNQVSVDFVSNAVNSDKFPFSQWSKLTRQILLAKNEGLLMKAPSTGIYELRNAIAVYLNNFRGIETDADSIVIGSGTEYLYSLVIQLLGQDKTYALEDPGYSRVSYILEGNGVNCIHVPLDKQGMNPVDLEKDGVSVVHLTPAHHYPTGIVMPIKRRLEFLDWVNGGSDRYIIEDDYDCEFRLQGKPIKTLFGSKRSDRIIYVNTFSKTLAPSFRISYMVLPQGLMKLFREKLGYISCTVPNLEQYVLARFITEGYFERHINRMRVYYRTQRNIMLSEITKSKLNSSVKVCEENAGLHFLLKVDTKMSDEELVKRLAEAGIRILCLSNCAYNKNIVDEHTLIINYSGINRQAIAQAVKLLGDVIAFS